MNNEELIDDLVDDLFDGPGGLRRQRTVHGVTIVVRVTMNGDRAFKIGDTWYDLTGDTKRERVRDLMLRSVK